MRENMGLFRGKLKASNEWAFGNLQVTKSGVAIITPDDTPIGKYGQVDPETVGECTGLKDKNGKLVFEGDIFHFDFEIVALVIFEYGCFKLKEYGLRGAWTESGFDECGGGWGPIDEDNINMYYTHTMKVIGNVHDNPELLKGESK